MAIYSKNWRGIALLSVPSIVFTHILSERLKGTLGGKLREEQAGFSNHALTTLLH